MNYSIIIPIYNEYKNLKDLIFEINSFISSNENNSKKFEVIIVDDGSKDNTFNFLKNFKEFKFKGKIIKHRKNYSQSSAILSGINNSAYENVVIMDGDLQNDANDINRLIEKFEQGFDLVVGNRNRRKDSYLTKKLPSYIANSLVRFFFNSKIKDNGCALKVFKKKLISFDYLWGDFHRLLSSRMDNLGFKIDQIDINHRERKEGKSNYGLSRIYNVLIDIIFQKFFFNYERKVIYLFGKLSIYSFICFVISLAYMFYLKLSEGISFIQTPMPLIVIFFLFISILIILIGLIAQLVIVNSEKFNSEKIIEEIITF